MCRHVLAPACLLVLALAGDSFAGFAVLAPSAAATRVSTDFNGPNPTYSLSGVQLTASRDARYGGSFTDIGVRFDLGTAVPAGATIASATLSVAIAQAFSIRSGRDAATLDVAGFGVAGGPLALTDFLAPYPAANVGSASIPFASGITSFAVAPIRFDVTSLLGSILAGGSPAVMFQFEASPDTSITLAGPREAGDGGGPSLVITFAATVPEPASALLAGLGVALAAGAGRLARRPRHRDAA